MVRPELSSKQHGGPHGECVECERVWTDIDGMPAGTRDRYTLREKSAALVALANGATYRDAANEARKRGGYARRSRGALLASRDGRLTGDWVSQYTPILAEHYLPQKWPRVLMLDLLPVHKSDSLANTPGPTGVLAFNVLAAASYIGDRAVLWRVGASRTRDKRAWLEFLGQLPGEPQWVVCDRNQSQVNAVNELWPNARVYACTAHLAKNVEDMMRKGKLWDRRRMLSKVLHESTFTKPEAYVAFRNVLARYLAADLSKATKAQVDELQKLGRWMANNEDHIAQSLVERHWPVTIGQLERPLRVIKNNVFDRRANLRNMDRLSDLLTLMQLKQMGHANEQEWAKHLRSNHRHYAGKPPPRRRVDDPRLAPR